MIAFLKGWERGYFSLGDSSDAMFRMYFMPSDEFTLLFGDGQYETEHGYYMSTDVGYMRHMLFYGVIGEMLGYSSFIIMLIALAKGLRYIDYSREIPIMLFILTFFFEMKGDLFWRHFGIVLALCICGISSRFAAYLNNEIEMPGQGKY